MQISTAGGVEGRRYPSPLVKQDLAKLGKDAESRRAALGSLRTVIEEHLQGAALPRFLHQVEDSAEGRRHAAAIVADLARVHGDRLPPHIPRLLQILAHTLLASAASPGLQSDCAKAIAAIARHSASTPSSAEHVLGRLCLPLIALLPHKVELLSAGAAACLSALVESETWKFAAAPLVSKLCLRAAMALASRSAQTVPHMNLLRSLASANASALSQFSIPLLRLLNQEILLSPCASWQLRLAAIHVMESLLKAAEQTALASQLGVSLQTLAKCRLDKMPHVRKAARNVLRTADALAAKADMKRKLVEDLPQLHSQTEPSSPVHHSLEFNGNIEDMFKTTLSSPRSQRSHALFLSPRTLADLAITSPSGKHLEIQTPPSEQSPGRATTDDSDYFCAYFFDTKENVSCRKIVHHIHDTATGSATPPSSPLKQGRKVAVPPLALSNVVHDSGQATKIASINAQSQSAVSTPSSFTRHVTVLDSHAELLASCERTLICAENNANHQEPAASTQTKPEMDEVDSAEDLTVNFHRKSEDASDLEFIDNFAKSQIKQIYAEQRMHAMEDLQAISNRLLEIREGEEDEDEDVKRKIDWDIEQQKQSSLEHQGRIQEAVGKQDEGQLNTNHGSSCYSNSDNIQKQQQEYLKDSVGAEASCHHDTQEGLTGKEEDGAETSSGEWSVRDNPIAEGQLYHRPASDAQLDSKHKEEETGSNAACPITDNVPQQKPMATREDLNTEEYEEAEDEALESCQSEASESEDEGATEKLETCQSPTSEPAEIGGRDEGLNPHMSVGSRTSPSLRRFLMRSTACVIPGIAVVTLAKLLHLELLPQHADSSDYFVPPT